MHEGNGKGSRVTGFFIFLIGAGIILDSSAHALGGLIALSGAVIVGWGLLQTGSRRRVAVDGSSSEGSSGC